MPAAITTVAIRYVNCQLRTNDGRAVAVGRRLRTRPPPGRVVRGAVAPAAAAAAGRAPVGLASGRCEAPVLGPWRRGLRLDLRLGIVPSGHKKRWGSGCHRKG